MIKKKKGNKRHTIVKKNCVCVDKARRESRLCLRRETFVNYSNVRSRSTNATILLERQKIFLINV